MIRSEEARRQREADELRRRVQMVRTIQAAMIASDSRPQMTSSSSSDESTTEPNAESTTETNMENPI